MFFSKKSPPASAVVPQTTTPAPTPVRPVTVAVAVAAAAPTVPDVASAPVVAIPEPLVECASSPRGFAPPAGRLLQRQVHRLRKQLRGKTNLLTKQRRQSFFVSESWAAPVDASPAVAVPPTDTAFDVPTPQPVPTPDTRLVEMQYEVLDLRHQLEALTSVPALDAAAVTALATKAPAFTEVQYEVAELHHQVQELQKVVATLKAAMGATNAGIMTSKLAILDDQGRTVASISGEGVVSCSSVVLRANAQ